MSQREVDVDTRHLRKLARGLASGPDVILVGECATLKPSRPRTEARQHWCCQHSHTDATETIRDRFVLPAHHRNPSSAIGWDFKGVISMRLVRAKQGAGGVPAMKFWYHRSYSRIHRERRQTYLILRPSPRYFAVWHADWISRCLAFFVRFISMEEVAQCEQSDEFRCAARDLPQASHHDWLKRLTQ